MGDTASLGSFIARSSEACAAVVIAERHPSDQPGWLVVVSPVPTLLAPGGGANIIVTKRVRASAGSTRQPTRTARRVPSREQRLRACRVYVYDWILHRDWGARVRVHSPPSLNRPVSGCLTRNGMRSNMILDDATLSYRRHAPHKMIASSKRRMPSTSNASPTLLNGPVLLGLCYQYTHHCRKVFF